MKYLEELHQIKIFHKNDVVELIKNKNSAKEILRRYRKQGYIAQVRRDLYVVNDLANKASLVNKFEIASNITPSSYIAYHTALEYHGIAHQIFYQMCVSSKEKFNNFDYEGINYIFCQSISDIGVVNPFTDSLISVTDLERTVIDCINRIDLCGGLEELVQCFAIITYINENKLMEYLQHFDKQVLYQKTGFMLSYFQKEMRLSDAFFSFCKSKIGLSTRYLTDNKESNAFFKEWKLCAPKNILSFLEQGGTVYV
jgi:predicted transcriptional regulator of viral defense system